MAQRSAVLESLPCEGAMTADAATDSTVDVGEEEGAEADTVAFLPSISMIGLTVATMVGSFAISSGLERNAERISPDPADEGGFCGVLLDGEALVKVIFFNISDKISS